MFDTFITAVRTYCAEAGIKPSTLTLYAVKDSKLLDRLGSGGQCLPRTMERVLKYMADHPPSERARAQPDPAVRSGEAA